MAVKRDKRNIGKRVAYTGKGGVLQGREGTIRGFRGNADLLGHDPFVWVQWDGRPTALLPNMRGPLYPVKGSMLRYV